MELALTLPGLFVAAFVAATPVPMNSEMFLVGTLVAGMSDPLWLIAVASVGNTLGSLVTYGAGRGLGGARIARLFRLPPERLQRAETWFGRYGPWSLLLSWAPGGDVLCFAAGALRLPVATFALVVAIAKTARYAVLAAATLGIVDVVI